MRLFRSLRARLEATFLLLGFATMGLMGWQATTHATDSLRAATFDHLNATREARALQIERFFHDAGEHLSALAVGSMTYDALDAFRTGFNALPEESLDGPRRRALLEHYTTLLTPLATRVPAEADPERWLPRDGRTIALQSLYIVENPHPPQAKDLLLDSSTSGPYDDAHVKYHPAFHRYAAAFGFYDIFLIDGATGQVLYTAFKEVDLGMRLTQEPYRETGLARAFTRAMRMASPGTPVIEDYDNYGPSGFAPAAFLAAPISRGGVKVGVIAVQVAIDEVNRVMTAEGRWREEGLGETGHAYILGRDGSLRSDVRFGLENPARYFADLETAGIPSEQIKRIRADGTGILNLTLPADHLITGPRNDPLHLQTVDFRDVPVLRTTSALNIPGLDWRIVAEMDSSEAFAPVHDLRNRMIFLAGGLTLVLLMVARLLAVSATRPLVLLADGVKRLGGREFGTRVAVTRGDELGELAAEFNRMAESLEKTTVSREELELLAGKLITAQEEERKRIASDLHDDFSQRLAALAIDAGNVERTLRQPVSSEGRLADEEALRAKVGSIRQGIAQVGDDIHGISRRLHPVTLEDLGLHAAMESECRAFFERGGAPVKLDTNGEFDHLAPQVALALYRILQEALRNIEKHASAQDVDVLLTRSEQTIVLEIKDNGLGFTPDSSANRRGLGLSSISERVRYLGGQFHLESADGRGTKLTIQIPWRSS